MPAAEMYAALSGSRIDAQTPSKVQVSRFGGVLVLRSHEGGTLRRPQMQEVSGSPVEEEEDDVAGQELLSLAWT
jgi:hypothetical protein